MTWTAACAPIAIVATIPAFLIIAKINPPAPITKEQISEYVANGGLSKTMSPEEKRLVLIIAVMFVCWIAGSWITKLNMVAVAMIGVVVMLLPIDAIPLYCYNYGYFTSGELTKTTVWIQLALAVITAVWLPIAANFLFPYVG